MKVHGITYKDIKKLKNCLTLSIEGLQNLRIRCKWKNHKIRTKSSSQEKEISKEYGVIEAKGIEIFKEKEVANFANTPKNQVK